MHWVLAIDHRNSFRTLFPGITATQAGRAKELVLDALLTAAAQGLDGGAPAILVDEEYGATVIHRAKQAGITVVVPVEVSGQQEFAFLHGDDGFGPAIERVDPTYVKALVRYNPAEPTERNRRQRAQLVRLQRWLTDHGRDWMLELLVPPKADIDPVVWDRDQRPRLTVQAIGQLVDAGLQPAFWKLEGQRSSADYAAVAAATRCAGRDDSRCLVLGRGADPDAVDRWIRLAAPLSTYGGFAVGRTLWWPPLADLLGARRRDEPNAVAAIAHNYHRLVAVYLEALRTGGSCASTRREFVAGPQLDSGADPATQHGNPRET